MATTNAAGTCTSPGCNATAWGGKCRKHRHEKRNRSGGDPRPYRNANYQKLRKVVLKEEPICRICKKFKSVIVDHINGDNTDNRRENLQGACNPCNTRKG